MGLGRSLPLPYFKLDKAYHILDYSLAASEVFLVGDDFLSLVDDENKAKVRTYVASDIREITIELNLKTKKDPLLVFEVSVSWEGDTAHLICVEQGKQVDRLSNQLLKLRSRLSETDFELLEKKEELEQAMERIHQLSGPFISLNKEAGLVPLFGDLEKDKLQIIEHSLLEEIDKGDYNDILFDFHGVGEITKTGVSQLDQLFETIQLMGASTIIVGLSPQQVKVFSGMNQVKMPTLPSLQHALDRYVKKQNR